MPKKVVIIGGGMSGLCTGIYLQMSGFYTQIFEMGNKIGGSCNSVKLGEFVFEENYKYTVGTRPDVLYGGIWKELNAFDFDKLSYSDIFKSIEFKDGRVFNFYCNFEKLLNEVENISSEDVKEFKSLTDSALELLKTNIPYQKPKEILSLIDYAKFLVNERNFFNLYNKWKNVSIEDFCQRLVNEDLKNVLRFVAKDSKKPIFDFVVLLADFCDKGVGYPENGHSGIIDNLLNKYISLGGQISTEKKVSSIITNDDALIGVKLDCETIISADIVVSTIDAYTTFLKLLEANLINDDLKKIFNQWQIDESVLKVFVGTSMDFSHKPKRIIYQIDNIINNDVNTFNKKIEIILFGDKEGLAPEGKTSILINLKTNYNHWKDLRAQGLEKYNNEKENIALQLLEFLDKKFEGFTQSIEELEIITPLDFYERTNNKQGSYWGWKRTVESLHNYIGKEFYDLDNFYFSGKWSKPVAGLHDLALTARDTVQIICKQEGVKFKSVDP